MNLLGILSFSGVIFGILLKKIAKEEIKPGKKYFNLILRISLAIIGLILMYNFKVHWVVILGILIAYFIDLDYLFLGISYVILSNYLLFVMIFIFGLPYGTLLSNSKRVLKDLLLYLLPLILIINNINVQFGVQISSLTAGYLLTRAIKWK